MACSQIIRTQHLKTDIQTLWDFVSSPVNLNEITPKDMQFQLSPTIKIKNVSWHDYTLQGVTSIKNTFIMGY